MTCDHDCLHCQYEDCVNDEDATPTEMYQARRRDRLLTQPEQIDRERERKKQQNAEYQAAYRAAHKEELNAKQRERYARDPAYRAAKKAATAAYYRQVRKKKYHAWKAKPVTWYDEYGRDYVRAKRKERNDERDSL